MRQQVCAPYWALLLRQPQQQGLIGPVFWRTKPAGLHCASFLNYHVRIDGFQTDRTMFSTLTTKGQITLPKAIRDKLGLDAGSQLRFELLPDNTIQARAVKADARSVRGLLKSPLLRSPGVEAEDAALAQHLLAKHGPP